LNVAMRRVSSAVLFCATARPDAPGETRVTLHFAPTGEVTAAHAAGVDHALALCVEAAVTRAHVPRFAAEDGFDATHTFALR
jgi:hypothetical protein